MKKCLKCGQSKNLKDFYKHPKTKDGRQFRCKQCHIGADKEYMKKYDSDPKNKLKRKNYNRKYNANPLNKEKKIKYNQLYNQEYYSNLEKRQKKLDYQRNYDSDPKNKLKKILNQKNYYSKKYGKDINYTLSKVLRNRIYFALKNNSSKNRSLELLGCNIKEWKEYLESQFTPEMTWENYGSYWEIDHIKPCSLFDLTKLEEQQKCFNYTNTQPLVISDNRQKSNKYEN